jgi:hypothetical protein
MGSNTSAPAPAAAAAPIAAPVAAPVAAPIAAPAKAEKIAPNSSTDKEEEIPSLKDLSTDARNQRLTSVKKWHEEHYRAQLKKIAEQKCKPEIHHFGDCVKETGFMVVFKCQEHNKLMNQCLDKYYNEQEFEKFMNEKGLTYRK